LTGAPLMPDPPTSIPRISIFVLHVPKAVSFLYQGSKDEKRQADYACLSWLGSNLTHSDP
jgi:hypothetical protein